MPSPITDAIVRLIQRDALQFFFMFELLEKFCSANVRRTARSLAPEPKASAVQANIWRVQRRARRHRVTPPQRTLHCEH
jgi:hypothetical protein